MVKISIIVPVHNVEKYLERCLNSIMPQINEQDEIILINDDSIPKEDLYTIKNEENKPFKDNFIFFALVLAV